jgi:uncharacterized integral membrane protein
MAKKAKKTTSTNKIEETVTEEMVSKKEEMQEAAANYWSKKPTKGEGKALLFNKMHFMIFGGGFLLVIIGFFLMSGGAMPDENTWKPEVIYSFTRITLAPIVVLIGLGVVGYALFYKSKEEKMSEVEEPGAER